MEIIYIHLNAHIKNMIYHHIDRYEKSLLGRNIMPILPITNV